MPQLDLQNLSISVSLALVGLGVLVGAYGTLIGAGGGFLLVPVLLLVAPKLEPAVVTAISLTVVFFNAYAGTWAYARMGRIDYRAGLLFAVAGIPGALLGTWVIAYVSRGPFDLTFGLLLLGLSVYLILRPVHPGFGSLDGFESRKRLAKDGSLLGSIGSAYLGLLSSLLGIGGGILHVPFLIRILRFRPHVATATSQFILALTSLTAAISHLLGGRLNSVLGPTAFLALGVMMGAPVGASISGLFRGPALVRLLALALGAVAIRLLWRLVG